MLAISTAWRSEIMDSGKEIVEEILRLGVNTLELEYRVSRSNLREMEPYPNFVLSTGCDLPQETPRENIQAFMDAGRLVRERPVLSRVS